MIDLLDDVWLIDPLRMESIVRTVELQAPHVNLQGVKTMTVRSPRRDNGMLAVIFIDGILLKGQSLLSLFFDTTSSVAVADAVRRAADDPGVAAILLIVDSPGGSTKGLADAADAIFEARKQKPVFAYCDGLCASAAFHLTSQAGVVWANRGAMIGSIGARLTIVDSHVHAENLGFTVHGIASAAFKAAGLEGTEVTPEQLREFQRVVDDVAAQFVRDVARGRGVSLPAAKEWHTGQIWMAADALQKRMIDGIARGGLPGVLQRVKSEVFGETGVELLLQHEVDAANKTVADEKAKADRAEADRKSEQLALEQRAAELTGAGHVTRRRTFRR